MIGKQRRAVAGRTGAVGATGTNRVSLRHSCRLDRPNSLAGHAAGGRRPTWHRCWLGEVKLGRTLRVPLAAPCPERSEA